MGDRTNECSHFNHGHRAEPGWDRPMKSLAEKTRSGPKGRKVLSLPGRVHPRRLVLRCGRAGGDESQSRIERPFML